MATASQGSFGEELARARSCPDTRRRIKAAVQRAAARAERDHPRGRAQEDRPPASRSRGLLGGLFAAMVAAVHRHFGLILFVLSVATCVAACACVPAEAIRQAETEHAINLGHANDAAISSDARAVGRANAEAWSAQYRALTGREPRIAERELGE